MKTKETSDDRMGKCEKCGATQFLSYITCNYNGICKGKVIPLEKSTREQASKWFASKSYLEQHELSDKYFESRNPSLLTIEQVEEIWRKENPIITKGLDLDGNVVIKKHYTNNPKVKGFIQLKQNQKQFKVFDESLFKDVIDKFSTRDLSIAFDVFITRLLEDGFIKDNLIEAIKNK